MHWKDYDEYAATYSRMRKCPICGKEFLPAIEHAWKIVIREYGEPGGRILKVCSYTCMRKWEKEQYGR